jgi:steroid Delta-isomerase
MAEHAINQQKRQKNAVAVARKVVKKAVANTEEQGGAKIVVLTADPHRNVVIVPGCHLDSMRQEENVYFFEDGNVLVGMIVEGGTVEYHPADRTYVVRLTNGRHARLNSTTDMAQTEAAAPDGRTPQDRSPEGQRAPEEPRWQGIAMRLATPSTDEITQAVNSYVELLAKGNGDDIAALYSDGATVEDPVGSEARRGRNAIRELYADIETYSRESELVWLQVAEREAAFLCRVTVTDGNSRTRIEGIDVMSFDDNAKITSMKAFWGPANITRL